MRTFIGVNEYEALARVTECIATPSLETLEGAWLVSLVDLLVIVSRLLTKINIPHRGFSKVDVGHHA